VRLGLKEAPSKVATRRTEIGYEAHVDGTSQQVMAKSIAIKVYRRKFSERAMKVIKLTVGDLHNVAKATEAAERQPDHWAEVSRGRSR
jgi:hypothetical protein